MNAVNDPLRDTRWRVQTVDGAALPVNHAVAAPVLILNSQSQKIGGSTGCNRLTGRYVQRGTQLVLKVGATRRACPEAPMQAEQSLLQALSAIDAYRIEGRTLSLLQGDTVRATFINARSKKRR